MTRREKDDSNPGKTTAACMSQLLDEIRRAVAWSRPSILLAVHPSGMGQMGAVANMERSLRGQSLEVEHVLPSGESKNILNEIGRRSGDKTIFFVQQLGNQPRVYHGLNMFRELIVEQSLKIIFWLTTDELVLLSQHAPDLWAFRHRVIEFPGKWSPSRGILPSGVLLWQFDDPVVDLAAIHKSIYLYEKMLIDVPLHEETAINHAHTAGTLAYYYWLIGDNHKTESLMDEEIKNIENFGLADASSALMNIQAINSYDQGNYATAFQWVEVATGLNPNQAFLWANHGVICRVAGNSRRSASSLKKAVKFDPASVKICGMLGYMNMSLGKYDSALHYFDVAMRLFPNFTKFHPAMATCCMRMGDNNGFDRVIRDMAAENDDGYLVACRDGLLGNVVGALTLLGDLVATGKISQSFVRRDPNLHFIFDNADLSMLAHEGNLMEKSFHEIGK